MHEMLSGGADMAAGCRQENHQNAGLELGAFIGAAAAAGRDKLTVVLPPSLSALGLWIEQLVAESTGKHGKGALPVVDEPLGTPDEYGADRCFVAVSTDREAPDAARLSALEAAGHPVLHLTTRLAALGAEFFRWEFATAIAGAILAINPFDEPNVAEAKEKTKAILAKGDFGGGTPVASDRRRVGVFVALQGIDAGRRRARGDRVAAAARLRRVPVVSARGSGDRIHRSRHPRGDSRADARREHVRRRSALSALHRAVPQRGPEHDRRLRHHGRGRDGDADPGCAVSRSSS